MENKIHILPTDKPSRLYQLKNDILRLDYKIDKGEANKHIYITNSEEIEWDSYWLNRDNNVVSNGAMFELADKAPSCKKIILTTDQDLIKDSVQAIDDEFLEWFVKNPSCEYVEVAKTNKLIDLYADKEEDKWEVKYHIYIPIEDPKQRLEKYSERFDNDKSAIGNPETWGKRMVEEPKQETIKIACVQCCGTGEIQKSTNRKQSNFECDLCNGKGYWNKVIEPKQESFVERMKPLQEQWQQDMDKELMKQETLEEAAKRLYPLRNTFLERFKDLEQKIFIEGAKWQQERSYSEEDLKYAFEQGKYYDMTSFEEWFEQFKKK